MTQPKEGELFSLNEWIGFFDLDPFKQDQFLKGRYDEKKLSFDPIGRHMIISVSGMRRETQNPLYTHGPLYFEDAIDAMHYVVAKNAWLIEKKGMPMNDVKIGKFCLLGSCACSFQKD